MLNSCGVQTPTNPLPPCIMAPRNAAPAEIMRRAAEGGRRGSGVWLWGGASRASTAVGFRPPGQAPGGPVHASLVLPLSIDVDPAPPPPSPAHLAAAARQTFNRPAQLILVVLPDTGGVGWVMRMGGLRAWAGGLGGALPLLGMPGFLRGRALPCVGMPPGRVAV